MDIQITRDIIRKHRDRLKALEGLLGRYVVAEAFIDADRACSQALAKASQELDAQATNEPNPQIAQLHRNKAKRLAARAEGMRLAATDVEHDRNALSHELETGLDTLIASLAADLQTAMEAALFNDDADATASC